MQLLRQIATLSVFFQTPQVTLTTTSTMKKLERPNMISFAFFVNCCARSSITKNVEDFITLKEKSKIRLIDQWEHRMHCSIEFKK
jgi:hypothetical protein